MFKADGNNGCRELNVFKEQRNPCDLNLVVQIRRKEGQYGAGLVEEQVSEDSSSPNKEFTSYSYVTGNHQEFRLGSELPWTDLRMKGTDLLWLGQSQERGR